MAEIKEYTPTVIEAYPFPSVADGDQSESYATGSATGGKNNYAPEETPSRTFPTQTIANTVISDSFNTQSRRILDSFEFAKNGAIQIGEYEEGVSGDIRISPSGLIARNSDGDVTVTIDGTTGDATFKGTITAGSLIAGRTDIGTVGGNVFIDGENNRIIISDGTNDRILIGYLLNGF
jgi:hypothetical protein